MYLCMPGYYTHSVLNTLKVSIISFQPIGRIFRNKQTSIFIWVELVRPIAINSNYVWHKAAPSSGPSSPFIAFFSHADSRSWAEQAEAPLCSSPRARWTVVISTQTQHARNVHPSHLSGQKCETLSFFQINYQPLHKSAVLMILAVSTLLHQTQFVTPGQLLAAEACQDRLPSSQVLSGQSGHRELFPDQSIIIRPIIKYFVSKGWSDGYSCSYSQCKE